MTRAHGRATGVVPGLFGRQVSLISLGIALAAGDGRGNLSSPKVLMAKPLNLIVACAENRVIGRDNKLPWHIPEDMAWFLERTAGNVCVLGRICFESWPGVLHEGRRAVVISSQPERIRADAIKRFGLNATELVQVARNVPEALALAQRLPGEIMVCGGQKVFEETLPLADRLLLTLVHAEVAGDVYFPEWRHLPWREAWRREGRDANYRFTISQLESSRRA